MDDRDARTFFARYAHFFNQSLAGDFDAAEAEALYAPLFIAATPAGVTTGKNDDAFRQGMTQGYAHYRAIGTKEMQIRDVRVSPIDERHCVVHVAWTGVYARADRPDVEIPFDVHYLVQTLDGAPKVFGWVSGDETALLKQHGIV